MKDTGELLLHTVLLGREGLERGTHVALVGALGGRLDVGATIPERRGADRPRRRLQPVCQIADPRQIM